MPRWTFWWADRNGRWLRYRTLVRHPTLERRIRKIDEDPTAAFQVNSTTASRLGSGIDLSGAEQDRVAIGGFVATGRVARVQLTLASTTWEAPVWFCDPWPLAFHLLGQEGSSRWFDVRLRAATYEIEVVPDV